MTSLFLALLLACSGPNSSAVDAPVDAAAPPSTEVAAADAPVDADPQQDAAASDAAGTDAAPQPTSCLQSSDCGDGMICEGQGCDDDQPGVCVASARACTRDLKPYCGCDGTTFLSSGSCPGQRYQAAMPCPGDPLPDQPGGPSAPVAPGAPPQ